MAKVKPKRSYDSALRKQQASQTRMRILDAAQRLFAEKGYPASTVEAIAGAAGVAVDTVYAMTVHKSQGSQFGTVAFLVPSTESRLLTRELLYTAVTRAQQRLILVGPEEAIRLAVARPIARASGLRQALWGDSEHGAEPAERGI